MSGAIMAQNSSKATTYSQDATTDGFETTKEAHRVMVVVDSTHTLDTAFVNLPQAIIDSLQSVSLSAAIPAGNNNIGNMDIVTTNSDTTVTGSDQLKVIVMNSASAGNSTSGKQDTIISILEPTAFNHTTKTVTGSATTLGSALTKRVVISNPNYSGVVYLGGSGVSTSSYGYKLNPGMATPEILIDNLNDIYVIGDAITIYVMYSN